MSRNGVNPISTLQLFVDCKQKNSHTFAELSECCRIFPRILLEVSLGGTRMYLIAHPHLLVRETSERFLPSWSTFRVGLISESHWLQLVMILTIHW